MHWSLRRARSGDRGRPRLGKIGVVPETDARTVVDDFAAVLRRPCHLTETDVAHGWSENTRAVSVTAIGRVLADLDRGWGEEAEYASHQLVRALDH